MSVIQGNHGIDLAGKGGVGVAGRPIIMQSPASGPSYVDDRASLEYDWEGSSGISIDVGVDAWTDTVNSDVLAQSTGVSQPSYSDPTLTFDGNSDRILGDYVNGALTFPYAIALVFKLESIVSNKAIIDGNIVSTRHLFSVNASDAWNMACGPSLIWGAADTLKHSIILQFDDSAANSNAYLDTGAQAGTSFEATLGGSGGMTVGDFVVGGGLSNVSIDTIRVYDNRLFTNDEINNLGGFLSQTYGTETWVEA